MLGLAGAYGFRLYGFEGIYIATESMAPTLPTGTHVIVNKFASLLGSPKHGDVVMFEIAQEPGKGLVKRVIGLPGDVIEIKNKIVFLNHMQLRETYTQYVRKNEILNGDNIGPMTVPDGHVFVMGDNRDVSNDSRDWETPDGQAAPFLPIKNIQGLVKMP